MKTGQGWSASLHISSRDFQKCGVDMMVTQGSATGQVSPNIMCNSKPSNACASSFSRGLVATSKGLIVRSLMATYFFPHNQDKTFGKPVKIGRIPGGAESTVILGEDIAFGHSCTGWQYGGYEVRIFSWTAARQPLLALTSKILSKHKTFGASLSALTKHALAIGAPASGLVEIRQKHSNAWAQNAVTTLRPLFPKLQKKFGTSLAARKLSIAEGNGFMLIVGCVQGFAELFYLSAGFQVVDQQLLKPHGGTSTSMIIGFVDKFPIIQTAFNFDSDPYVSLQAGLVALDFKKAANGLVKGLQSPSKGLDCSKIFSANDPRAWTSAQRAWTAPSQEMQAALDVWQSDPRGVVSFVSHNITVEKGNQSTQWVVRFLKKTLTSKHDHMLRYAEARSQTKYFATLSKLLVCATASGTKPTFPTRCCVTKKMKTKHTGPLDNAVFKRAQDHFEFSLQAW